MLFFCGEVFAQSGVNREELGSAAAEIEFENNSSHPVVRNTLDEIRQIGYELARGIRDEQGNKRYNVRVGTVDRYSMIEAVGGLSEIGLAADVIELGKNVGVDHIRNLRVIIAGYLEASYAYIPEEANELAVLITIYNAVNRKKTDRFTEYYQKTVAARLDKNRVGLAASFREWPGSTQIVIPLYSPAGDNNFQISVETIVEDEAVKTALKKEPDKVDVERLLRDQKAREETAWRERETAEKRAEQERVAREASVREAAKTAADRVVATERSLEGAIERVRRETERLKRYEEDTVAIRNEAEQARREIVLNKFGIPLAGNEAAVEKDVRLANQEKLVERQREVVEAAKRELAGLEEMLERDRLDAAEKTRYAQSLGGT
jgi:hypothetical protein